MSIVERDDGIFAALFEMNQKNPADAGLVRVIPSDAVCTNPVANIVTKDWRQHWFSFHPNPFLLFDFSPRKVVLSAYLLQTYSGAEGFAHMKSWVLEGSCGDNDFEIIDQVTDSTQLNACDARAVFPINQSSQPYERVRIRMVGTSHAGSDFMVVRRVEFFGQIVEPQT